MVYISSVGIGCPKTTITQEQAKQLTKEVFKKKESKVKRLLPIFDNAKITYRQIAMDVAWYQKETSFAARNDLYIKQSIKLSLKAIDQCLSHERLQNKIDYQAIDLIVFVSSTGIATPSIDAYLINERPFKEDILRMPLWGLGCGGGAIGLSRAADWLEHHRDKSALVVCAELCSLTFQQNDFRTSNIVGTAIFGDGVAATLLIGEESPLIKEIPNHNLTIVDKSSYLKKETLDIMGWKIVNHGFEVVFSKRIPRLVTSIWKNHVEQFIQNLSIDISDLDQAIAHPGGRKVLEEMERVLHNKKDLLTFSYDILRNHGNMSSATVLYVLKKYMETKDAGVKHNKWALLSALGPGFCSELLALRWITR